MQHQKCFIQKIVSFPGGQDRTPRLGGDRARPIDTFLPAFNRRMAGQIACIPFRPPRIVRKRHGARQSRRSGRANAVHREKSGPVPFAAIV
jgi:hypothetical protein